MCKNDADDQTCKFCPNIVPTAYVDLQMCEDCIGEWEQKSEARQMRKRKLIHDKNVKQFKPEVIQDEVKEGLRLYGRQFDMQVQKQVEDKQKLMSEQLIAG